jgi:prophage tail gpP-like protein
MLSGYTNSYAPSGDGKTHSVLIQGRGRGQDFVDSAAVHDTGMWENKTPDQIAKDLDKFGVGIKAMVPLQPIPMWNLYQGETAHGTIERALRDQFATMMGTADGSIEITNASVAKRHSGGLIEGHNILKFSGKITDDRRFSETTVKGQRREGVKASDLRVTQRFKDTGIRRYRPKILVQETDTNKDRALRRAQHESERAQGFSVRATIITQGWRDDGGKVWEPNHLVFVQSPSLKIAGDMLIETVTYTQSSKGGTVSEIGLVHPKAYKGKAGAASKTSSDWGGD